jgi:hypothetical protein
MPAMTKKRRNNNAHIEVGGNVSNSVIHAGDVNIGLPKVKWPFAKKKANPPADEETLELIDALSKQFTLDEMESICLELGIEFEDLPSRTRSGKARQLVQQADKLKRRNNLLKIMRRDRPE